MTKPLVIFEPDGSLTIDIERVAPRLGLTPELFMAEVQAKRLFRILEKGEGEDAGRWRITFRYRSKECQVTVNSSGHEILAKIR